MVGAIAAGVQAMELERVMSSESVEPSQLIASCAGLNGRRWRLSRSESCRFEHRRLPIEARDVSPEDCSLASLLRAAEFGADWTLAAPGHRFVTGACCSRCESSRSAVSLEATLVQKGAPCPDCGAPFSPRTLRTIGSLCSADISAELIEGPLTEIGVRAMDVLELRDAAGNERYFGMGVGR
jgi:hypothetical protein